MTTTAFRLAQARQLTVREILISRYYALVRGARVSDTFSRLFCGQRLEEFKLAQAESAARFALRHNGQEPADRLLGATRARLAQARHGKDHRRRSYRLYPAAARHVFCLLG
jgi:hypothetical protein